MTTSTEMTRVELLVQKVEDGMTLKFIQPLDDKTQAALVALRELAHLADLRQKERAGWEIRTFAAESAAQNLEEQLKDFERLAQSPEARARDYALNAVMEAINGL